MCYVWKDLEAMKTLPGTQSSYCASTTGPASLLAEHHLQWIQWYYEELWLCEGYSSVPTLALPQGLCCDVLRDERYSEPQGSWIYASDMHHIEATTKSGARHSHLFSFSHKGLLAAHSFIGCLLSSFTHFLLQSFFHGVIWQHVDLGILSQAPVSPPVDEYPTRSLQKSY